MDLQEARKELIEKIKTYHPDGAPQIDAFFSRVVIQAAAGGFAMLTADNAFIKEWVENHYTDDIRRGMSELYGGEWMIAIEVDTTTQAKENKEEANNAESEEKNNGAEAPKQDETENAGKRQPDGNDEPEKTQVENQGESVDEPSDKKPEEDEDALPSTQEQAKPAKRRTETGEALLTFDNYIVGDSNRMAFGMAQEVANKPGQTTVNPLFIFGNSGVGKTHLLCAIKNQIEEEHPELKIRYIDAMEMVNEYGQAAINKTFQSFEDSFRALDVLLVDDIQRLEGKNQTVDILFRLFNELIPKGKQFVFSADKHPKEMKNIDERYRSRFASGGTVDVNPPDAETKRNIAKSFLGECQESEDFPLELSDDVLDYISENSGTNVRELKSAVTNLVFALKLDPDHTITREQAKRLLGNHFTAKARGQVSMEAIKDEICEYYGVTKSELTGPGRGKKIKLPRSVAIYLCREMLECTFATIGEGFGRTHSTIMHSYEVICEQIGQDPRLQDEIDDIKSRLETPPE